MEASTQLPAACQPECEALLFSLGNVIDGVIAMNHVWFMLALFAATGLGKTGFNFVHWRRKTTGRVLVLLRHLSLEITVEI